MGIVGFLTGTFISGWAGAHAAFSNGETLDVAPSEENLWLRNRLGEHELLISAILAVAFALIAVKARRKSAATV